MSNKAEFERRVKIARDLDVAAALKTMPVGIVKGGRKDDDTWADKNETVLAGLHKLRCASPLIFTPAEIELSRNWLTQNGWKVPNA